MEQRVIKFRGQAITGEWNHGHLLITEDNRAFILYPVLKESIDKYEVKRETVGQFTGLMDHWVKDIYEGDIIEFTMTDGEKETGIVRFSKDGFWTTQPEGSSEELLAEELETESFEAKVIGNVFDQKV